MNSQNSRTSDSHRPLLNLPDQTNLKRSHRSIALSSRNIDRNIALYMGKYKKVIQK